MLRALKFGVAVGLVVAVFETIKLRMDGTYTSTWSAATSGLQNPTTLAAAAAAALATLVF